MNCGGRSPKASPVRLGARPSGRAALRRGRAAAVALALAAMLATGCDGGNADPAPAVCVPGAGAFGDRCCAQKDCADAGTCQSGQCTIACDGGACAGLGPDGGAVACTSGFCVPPPLPHADGEGHGG